MQTPFMQRGGRRRLATAVTVLAMLAGLVLAPLPDAVTPASAQTAQPQTIWPANATPAVLADSENRAVEVGVRFRASSSGMITGVRFYKAATNIGTHVGSLWSATGTRLASVTFTSETASGWQQANFATPVQINASTTYVASYHAPNGRYSINVNGLASGVSNGAALRALANGEDGSNGVYRYGAAGTFPTQSWRSSNYWVDVVFQSVADTTAPTLTAQSPSPDATGVSTRTTVQATFSEPVQTDTIEVSLEAAGAPIPTTRTYDDQTRTVTATPTAELATATRHTVTVRGAKDGAGNTMAPVSWSFTTAEASAPPPPQTFSLWPDSTVPPTPAAADDSAVELGVRVRPERDGFITGLRFYKGSGNTGTHVGNLWSSSGTQLATATFTNETASGWQTVALPAPVAVTAGTTYIASYHAPVGRYAYQGSFFDSAHTSGPLTAPANAAGSGNGLYRYGGSGFPTNTHQAANYYVDVAFAPDATDTTPPTVTSQAPAPGAQGVTVSVTPSATFSEAVQASTLSFTLGGPSGAVAGSASYNAETRTAAFTPSGELAANTTYTATVSGGKDAAGNEMTPVTWTFTTGAPPPPPPTEGPGGPVLVITSGGDSFSRYYAEILRTEGMNAFKTSDVSTLNASLLAGYDVAVLAPMALTAAQVTTLTDWVTNGGNLVAVRPDKKLAGLLGLTDAGSTLTEGYLKVDNTQGPGIGIVGETMQYHGIADRYTLGSASTVASLYSNASTATTNPAVSLRSVGSSGGQAAAFTYDLARSIVYTRQGNPAWDGQERDGFNPRRSNDLFFGAASGDPKPDWVNLNKVAIPQADEQQRLLTNVIQHINRNRKPLPRFWYFPHNKKAVAVATGDDHGNGGTIGRFDRYKANSPVGCRVTDWECLRFGSYMYTNTPVSNTQASSYATDGFELGLHPRAGGSGGCQNYTSESLSNDFSSQLSAFRQKYTSLPAQTTSRTHCIVWSDWSSQASISKDHGIRMDTNYYYWPGSWVADRPGFFTGSGLPMRFTTKDGQLIDTYQATTQMTDESNQSYPQTPNALFQRALGAEGYYGAFTANMHTDQAVTVEDDRLLTSALAQGVPVVSGAQMLTWLDGRNASTFGSLAWQGNVLSFDVGVGTGATGLTAMVPTTTDTTFLAGITRNGTAVTYTTETIKGIHYAVFPAATGAYRATYAPQTLAATASATSDVDSGRSTMSSASTTEEVKVFAVEAEPRDDATTVVTWQTDLPADSTVEYGSDPSSLTRRAYDADPVTAHEVTLRGLDPGTTLYYRVSSTGPAGKPGKDPSASPRSVKTRAIDRTGPRVRQVEALPRPDGTTTIRWRTNEASSSRVVFGTAAGALTGARLDEALVTEHNVVLTGLEPGTTYHYRVESTDPAGNTGLGAPATFSTPAAGVGDYSITQWRMGTIDAGGYLGEDDLGELSLAPADGAEFSTPTLPASWLRSSTEPGGSVEVTGGALRVDGGVVTSKRSFGSGQQVEASVTFGGVTPQTVGFGSRGGPLAAFTARDGVVSATTIASAGAIPTSTALTPALLGNETLLANGAHNIRIAWDKSAVRFFVDGQLVATHNVSLRGALSALVSDVGVGGGAVSVHWARPVAYASASTYTSRVIDAHAMVNWDKATWRANVPSGTSLQLSVRTGSMATPDASWTAWRPLTASGASVGGAGSRYIQYRVDLKTTASDRTPVLEDISFTHDGPMPRPQTEEPG